MARRRRAPRDPSLQPNAIATEWLRRHRPDLIALVESGKLQLDPDENLPNAVRYTRVPVQGELSIFAHRTTLFVDRACGCVVGFTGDDRDFARTNPPSIDDAAARAIISAEYRRVSVDRLRLVESPQGYTSRTVYVADLTVALPHVRDRHPHVFWVFDADTGETIERYGDPRQPPVERQLPDGVDAP